MTKIVSFQLQNAKKIKAVFLTPKASGLTVIGGKSAEGKTSVLDALSWALGGAKYKPSDPKREGSLDDPMLSVILDNGLKVERKGKNSTLTVTDPSGQKGGQALLDAFVSEFALDLPKFMQKNSKDKAKALLDLLGVGDLLEEYNQKEQTIYNMRTAIGQLADSKRKHADELPAFPDVPEACVSASELIQAQQEILARNGENQKLRANVECLNYDIKTTLSQIDVIKARIADLQGELSEEVGKLGELNKKLTSAKKSTEQLQDESTEELEANIQNVETINHQVRANLQKQHALDEANEYSSQYDQLTTQIEEVRAGRLKLLDGCKMPLPELTIDGGELIFRGHKWDCMSGAEQLQVCTSIVKASNPECGFCLVDHLEQMDVDTLNEFGEWAEAEGLQVIGTRVSTGGECTIIIEDGLQKGQSYLETTAGVVLDQPMTNEVLDENGEIF